MAWSRTKYTPLGISSPSHSTVKQRWFWFYPIFLLALLNKETAILLVLAHLLVQREYISKRQLILHAILQVGMGVLVMIVLAIVFASNPGTGLEFHLHSNIHWLLEGYDLVALMVGGTLLFLVFHQFSEKPDLLKKLVLLYIPMGGLVVTFGVLVEVRSWMELLPIGLFLIIHTVVSRFLRISIQAVKPLRQEKI